MSASLTSFDASSSAQAGAPLALVTGASKGIGRAIAIGLARDGFNLCCTYNNDRARAEETAEEVRRYGVSCQRT